MPRRVLFDISGHGLGHLAISGPVVARLRHADPSAKIVVRTGLPEDQVRPFVGPGVEIVPGKSEATPLLLNAMATDREGTKERLLDLTRTFDSLVEEERAVLDRVGPDLVVANVSYIALGASQAAGIPNLALCCMNWADVFAAMDLGPACSDVIGRMRQTYAAADLFLQPAPHMTMADLPNRRSIGPIARFGRERRVELVRLLGLPRDIRLVLYSLGGITGPPGTVLPAVKDTRWIVSDEALATRSDIILASRIGWAFEDLVASVDAIVGKDSYGTVAEAACTGVPLVMIPRSDWPETECLVAWARDNCAFALAGAVGPELDHALNEAISQRKRAPVFPDGIDTAIDIMMRS